MRPHYDGSNHRVNVFGPLDQQWMALMTMSFLDSLAAHGRDPSTAFQPPGLADGLVRRIRAALERRRRRRALACLALSDHLRRDVGLPPFNERRW